jgi:hypothetical protein
MGVIATARFWRAVSTALFVCFLASLAFEGFSGVPGWGWLVLIASGGDVRDRARVRRDGAAAHGRRVSDTAPEALSAATRGATGPSPLGRT